MNLPSFLWLWKIAAWSMGLTILAYLLQCLSGSVVWYARTTRIRRPSWLRTFHYTSGIVMVLLVLLLLGIGLIGTIGHYGSLGQSSHLVAGILVVLLTLVSAWSATQINSRNMWARNLHLTVNILLCGGLIFVSFTGWDVVQKYLP